MELTAVCCQNLTLGALSVLDVALFKKVGNFLNTSHSTQYLRLRTIITQLVAINAALVCTTFVLQDLLLPQAKQ
jgi:hypothetical protein